MPVGAIAGGVVGGLVVAVIVAAILLRCLRRHVQERDDNIPSQEVTTPPTRPIYPEKNKIILDYPSTPWNPEATSAPGTSTSHYQQTISPPVSIRKPAPAHSVAQDNEDELQIAVERRLAALHDETRRLEEFRANMVGSSSETTTDHQLAYQDH
jgi:hypothetical protein